MKKFTSYKSLTKAPSRDLRYVICDVCGQKKHIRETIKVTDKFNRQFGLIVCKNDFDRPNIQDRPIIIDEEITANPEYMRPRNTLTYLVNENDDRLPGKPTNGQAIGDPINPYISLYWDAPGDNGSSPIRGYTVRRSPLQVDLDWYTISSDTETGSTYYSDTSATLTQHYAYAVAAINGYGTGPYSNPFYWPASYITDDPSLIYIIDSDGTFIVDSDGSYILG